MFIGCQWLCMYVCMCVFTILLHFQYVKMGIHTANISENIVAFINY